MDGGRTLQCQAEARSSEGLRGLGYRMVKVSERQGNPCGRSCLKKKVLESSLRPSFRLQILSLQSELRAAHAEKARWEEEREVFHELHSNAVVRMLHATEVRRGLRGACRWRTASVKGDELGAGVVIRCRISVE